MGFVMGERDGWGIVERKIKLKDTRKDKTEVPQDDSPCHSLANLNIND